MSDPEPTPPASAPVIEHEPAPTVPPREREPVPPRRRGGTPLPLTLLLTAGLGGGLYWVWTHPQDASGQAQAPVQAASDPQPAIEAARTQIMQAVQQQMQALAARVDALEKRPAPAPAAAGVGQDAFADAGRKIDDLSGRVDALSAKQEAQGAEIGKVRELAAQRPPQETASPPPDNTASQVPALIAGQQAADMGSRLDREKAAEAEALTQQRAATDQVLTQQKAALDGLEQRLAKLEANAAPADALKQQQDAAAQAAAQVAALGGRIDKLEQGSGQAASQEQDAARAAQQVQAEAKTQITAIASRVDKLEQGAGQAQGAARTAGRAIRIEAAEAALAAGQPLGPLPDAPPALARYATAPPPTEIALRAAFPQMAEAARAASQPDLSQRSFLDRALARVQQSVTVRRGDHVLVGDPASGILARAQDAVNAGDLKRAADTLGALNGPAAAAASDWVAQARALVDARAALAAMARG